MGEWAAVENAVYQINAQGSLFLLHPLSMGVLSCDGCCAGGTAVLQPYRQQGITNAHYPYPDVYVLLPELASLRHSIPLPHHHIIFHTCQLILGVVCSQCSRPAALWAAKGYSPAPQMGPDPDGPWAGGTQHCSTTLQVSMPLRAVGQ